MGEHNALAGSNVMILQRILQSLMYSYIHTLHFIWKMEPILMWFLDQGHQTLPSYVRNIYFHVLNCCQSKYLLIICINPIAPNVICIKQTCWTVTIVSLALEEKVYLHFIWSSFRMISVALWFLRGSFSIIMDFISEIVHTEYKVRYYWTNFV